MCRVRSLHRLVVAAMLGIAAVGLGTSRAQAASDYHAGGFVAPCSSLTDTSCDNYLGGGHVVLDGSVVWITDPNHPQTIDRFNLSDIPSYRGNPLFTANKQVTLPNNADLWSLVVANDGTLLVGASYSAPNIPETYAVLRLSADGTLLTTYPTSGRLVAPGPEGGFFVEVVSEPNLNEYSISLQRYAASGTPVGPAFAIPPTPFIASDGQTVYIAGPAPDAVSMFTATGSSVGTLTVPQLRSFFVGQDGMFYAISSAWEYPHVLRAFSPTTHELTTEADLNSIVYAPGPNWAGELAAVDTNGDLLVSGGSGSYQQPPVPMVTVYRRDKQSPSIDSLDVTPYTNHYASVEMKVSDPENNLSEPGEGPAGRAAESEYSVNGGSYRPLGAYSYSSITFPRSEPEGTKSIAVRVRDAAGHLSAPVMGQVILDRQRPTTRLKVRWVHGKPLIRVTAVAKGDPIHGVNLGLLAHRPGVSKQCKVWNRRRWVPLEGQRVCTEPPSAISLINQRSTSSASWTVGGQVRWRNGFDYLVQASAEDAAGNVEARSKRVRFSLPRHRRSTRHRVGAGG